MLAHTRLLALSGGRNPSSVAIGEVLVTAEVARTGIGGTQRRRTSRPLSPAETAQLKSWRTWRQRARQTCTALRLCRPPRAVLALLLWRVGSHSPPRRQCALMLICWRVCSAIWRTLCTWATHTRTGCLWGTRGLTEARRWTANVELSFTSFHSGRRSLFQGARGPVRTGHGQERHVARDIWGAGGRSSVYKRAVRARTCDSGPPFHLHEVVPQVAAITLRLRPARSRRRRVVACCLAARTPAQRCLVAVVAAHTCYGVHVEPAVWWWWTG
jgi:hypothetical protein